MRTLSVLAQNTSDGFFYPGYIHKNKPDEATTTVHFYSLKSQEVKQDNVIVVGGASPCPNLTTGDFVLVQVQYKTTWSVLYVPGVVVSPPNERDFFTKNFLVVTYTHVLVERPRRYLVKIGKEKHDSILESIKELHQRKNPMLRSDAYSSGGILKQRRLLKRAAASSCISLIHRKEIWANTHDKTWKSSLFRKTKARRLLTANLRTNNRRHILKQELKHTVGNKQEMKEHDDGDKSKGDKSTNKQLLILKEVIETNNSLSKDKQGTCETNGKNRDRSDRRKHKTNNQEKDDVVLTNDIEDELRDIREYPDERPKSATYSDTFESTNSKDSRNTDLAGSREEDLRVISTTVKLSSHKDAKEAWVDRSCRRTSKSTENSNYRSQSSKSPSQGTSKTSSRSSVRHTPTGKQQENRRHMGGSDDFSDDTNSTDRTAINDVLGQGQEVLARWSDDGWYYFGVIVAEIGDDEYVVTDATGYKETIDKTNILLDSEQGFQVLQPGDCVIALHPNYVFSYAPGRISGVYPSSSVTVQFYDRTITKLPVKEVYQISQDKYQKDVTFIKLREQNLCLSQNPVIARDDKSGFYVQCKVECPTNHGQKFFIRLPDMTFAKQSAIHIFPIKSHVHRKEQILEYALAPIETGSSVYLPACTIQWRPFCVQFCNGSISRDLQPSQCFYINQDYYNNASSYFHFVQTNHRVNKYGEARRYDSTKFLWPGSSSDIQSDRFSQQTYDTGVQRSSSSTSFDGSSSLSKKSSIERNLIHNPNAFEFRRKPKNRYISVQYIPE